jgi:hypothetical protein
MRRGLLTAKSANFLRPNLPLRTSPETQVSSHGAAVAALADVALRQSNIDHGMLMCRWMLKSRSGDEFNEGTDCISLHGLVGER